MRIFSFIYKYNINSLLCSTRLLNAIDFLCLIYISKKPTIHKKHTATATIPPIIGKKTYKIAVNNISKYLLQSQKLNFFSLLRL